jgi:hypothetical protein
MVAGALATQKLLEEFEANVNGPNAGPTDKIAKGLLGKI